MKKRAIRRLAETAVNEIVADLSDRRGLSGEWFGIDDDIRDEVVEVWTVIVEQAIAAARTLPPHPEQGKGE